MKEKLFSNYLLWPCAATLAAYIEYDLNLNKTSQEFYNQGIRNAMKGE